MTTLQPMTKQAEARFLEVVRDVVGNVEGGMHPTDAVVKTAKHYKLSASMLPLVVQAYNVGRTTFQQDHGRSILDKQADFPIARIEHVMGQVFPDSPIAPSATKAASAVAFEYSEPPKFTDRSEVFMEKAAEAAPPIRTREPSLTWTDREGKPQQHTGSVMHKLSKSLGTAHREKKAVETSRREYTEARDLFLASLGKLASYFKQPASFRAPYGEVLYNAKLMFGDPAVHAMKYAYTHAQLQEKQAAVAPRMLSAARMDREPYSIIKQAIDHGAELIEAQRKYDERQKQAAAALEDAFIPFDQALLPATPNIQASLLMESGHSSNEKLAVSLSDRLMAFGTGYATSAVNRSRMTQPPDSAVDSTVKQLSSPDHLQELRQIETRMLLHDLLSNDEVISGYRPDEVLNAYNEISMLAPRAAQQPAVIRPLLRKRLSQGDMAPFEAEETTRIEKTLQDTGSPSGMVTSDQLKSSPPSMPKLASILQDDSIKIR